VAMVEAMVRMGVPPALMTVLDKGYAYPNVERVAAHLGAIGVSVWHWTRATEALVDHAARARAAGRRPLLADNGGYTLPVLLGELPALASEYVGLVEQTSSGIRRLEPFEGRIPIPLFSVAQSRLKGAIEPYGIAEAAIRNTMALLPESKWEGQAAVVLGFGAIGRQVAETLRSRRMRVGVFDSDIVSLVAAHESGFVTRRSIVELLHAHRPQLVVGATGQTSLTGEQLDSALRPGADVCLVSVTSRQEEFALAEYAKIALAQEDLGRRGMRYLLSDDRVLTVVADGMPVNFHHAESLPNGTSDVLLAAMIVGIATLSRPDHGLVPGHNVARTDTLLDASGLMEHYYRLYGPSGD
jgi:S-adenosylhomocysteine hydrolase